MKKEVWIYVLLSLIIFFAVVLNFIPRMGYAYPIHADEWNHMAYAKNMSSAPLYFDKKSYDFELGFHFLIYSLNSIGIPYFFIFKFFPIILTGLTCIFVFLLARKMFNQTTGLFAVLFIAFLKTTPWILGPVYFVPVNFGLFLIPLGLLLLERNSRLFFIPFSVLMLVHPPSGLALLLLSLVFIFYKRKNIIRNLCLLMIGGILASPLYIGYFLWRGIGALNYLNFSNWVSGVFPFISYLGYVLFFLSILGIIFSIIRKKYLLSFYLAILFFLCCYTKFLI